MILAYDIHGKPLRHGDPVRVHNVEQTNIVVPQQAIVVARQEDPSELVRVKYADSIPVLIIVWQKYVLNCSALLLEKIEPKPEDVGWQQIEAMTNWSPVDDTRTKEDRQTGNDNHGS